MFPWSADLVLYLGKTSFIWIFSVPISYASLPTSFVYVYQSCLPPISIFFHLIKYPLIRGLPTTPGNLITYVTLSSSYCLIFLHSIYHQYTPPVSSPQWEHSSTRTGIFFFNPVPEQCQVHIDDVNKHLTELSQGFCVLATHFLAVCILFFAISNLWNSFP